MTSIKSKSDDSDYTKSAIISALDFEILNSQRETQKTGINRWLLIAALGTLSWMVLKELSDQAIAFFDLLLPLQCIFLAYDLYANTHQLLSQRLQIKSEVRFKYSRVTTSREYFLLELLRFSFFLIFSRCIGNIPSLYLNALIFSYAIAVVLLILVVLHTFIDFPVPITNPSKWMSVLITICLAFLTYGYSRALFDASFSWSSIEISSLIFALFWIFSSLIKDELPSVYVEQLISIRRELMLGNISNRDAQLQLEIIVLGLKGHHVVQRPATQLLEAIREITRLESNQEECYSKINELLCLEDIKQEHIDAIESNFDQVEQIMNNQKRTLNKMMSATKQLEKMINYVMSKDSSVANDIVQILKEVTKERSQYDKVAEQSKITLSGLKTKLAQKTESLK